MRKPARRGNAAGREAGSVCFEGDEVEFCDVEEAHVGELDLGDDGEGHEAERHDRLDIGVDAEDGMRLFVDLPELFVDPLAGLVAHEARDGHRHGGEYLPVLHKDDTTLLTLQLLDGEGHLGIIDADNDDIMRVVRDREGNGAGLDAIALQEGRGDVAGGLVALDHGNLDEVDGGVADEIAVASI